MKASKKQGNIRKSRSKDKLASEKAGKSKGAAKSHQERLNSFVEKLQKMHEVISPPYQREMLKRVVKGERAKENWRTAHDHASHFIGETNDCFRGCSKSFRQQVIKQYLENVLPPIEAEWEKEQAKEKAIAAFIDSAALDDKTTEQIEAMTAARKAESEGTENQEQLTTEGIRYRITSLLEKMPQEQRLEYLQYIMEWYRVRRENEETENQASQQVEEPTRQELLEAIGKLTYEQKLEILGEAARGKDWAKKKNHSTLRPVAV